MKKIAIIHWKDIATISDESMAWFSEEEAKVRGKEFYDHDHLTIGQIIEDNNEFVLIASTINANEEPAMYSDISMIMKSVITNVEYLKNE